MFGRRARILVVRGNSDLCHGALNKCAFSQFSAKNSAGYVLRYVAY